MVSFQFQDLRKGKGKRTLTVTSGAQARWLEQRGAITSAQVIQVKRAETGERKERAAQALAAKPTTEEKQRAYKGSQEYAQKKTAPKPGDILAVRTGQTIVRRGGTAVTSGITSAPRQATAQEIQQAGLTLTAIAQQREQQQIRRAQQKVQTLAQPPTMQTPGLVAEKQPVTQTIREPITRTGISGFFLGTEKLITIGKAEQTKGSITKSQITAIQQTPGILQRAQELFIEKPLDIIQAARKRSQEKGKRLGKPTPGVDIGLPEPAIGIAQKRAARREAEIAQQQFQKTLAKPGTTYAEVEKAIKEVEKKQATYKTIEAQKTPVQKMVAAAAGRLGISITEEAIAKRSQKVAEIDVIPFKAVSKLLGEPEFLKKATEKRYERSRGITSEVQEAIIKKPDKLILEAAAGAALTVLAAPVRAGKAGVTAGKILTGTEIGLGAAFVGTTGIEYALAETQYEKGKVLGEAGTSLAAFGIGAVAGSLLIGGAESAAARARVKRAAENIKIKAEERLVLKIEEPFSEIRETKGKIFRGKDIFPFQERVMTIIEGRTPSPLGGETIQTKGVSKLIIEVPKKGGKIFTFDEEALVTPTGAFEVSPAGIKSDVFVGQFARKQVRPQVRGKGKGIEQFVFMGKAEEFGVLRLSGYTDINTAIESRIFPGEESRKITAFIQPISKDVLKGNLIIKGIGQTPLGRAVFPLLTEAGTSPGRFDDFLGGGALGKSRITPELSLELEPPRIEIAKPSTRIRTEFDFSRIAKALGQMKLETRPFTSFLPRPRIGALPFLKGKSLEAVSSISRTNIISNILPGFKSINEIVPRIDIIQDLGIDTGLGTSSITIQRGDFYNFNPEYPRPPRIPKIPEIVVPVSWLPGGGGGGGGWRYPDFGLFRRTKRQPSLVARALGINIRKPKKKERFTGLEIRPILVGV